MCLLSFSSIDPAKIYVEALRAAKDTAAGVNPPALPVVSSADGFLSSFKSKRQGLYHISSSWADLCAAAPVPSFADLVGVEFEADLPVSLISGGSAMRRVTGKVIAIMGASRTVTVSLVCVGAHTTEVSR